MSQRWSLVAAGLCFVVLAIGPSVAENVDPAGDGSQYAYGENVGWINAEPSGNGGPGVQVGTSELSGWMWGENVGWISLSCDNSLSCATTSYGVTNDGSGGLAGFAWGENVGWISFSCQSTGSCGTASYGVVVNPATGDFSGNAWGENVGWITFNCASTGSCGSAAYKVRSGWVCSPPPAAPSDTPALLAGKSGADLLLAWNAVAGATEYDIVRGDLGALRSSGGDFSSAACADDNRTVVSLLSSAAPGPNQGLWFLVRGANCGGHGTYNSGGPGQIGNRDPELAPAPGPCAGCCQ